MRLSDELRFVKFSSIAWTHDSKGFFYQVRFNLFAPPRLIYSIRGFRIARRMASRLWIRWVWRLEVTRTLRSFTTESTPTNVCLLIYILRLAWSMIWRSRGYIGDRELRSTRMAVGRRDLWGGWALARTLYISGFVTGMLLCASHNSWSKLEIEKSPLAGRPWEGTDRFKLQLD